jgi:3-oxoacyl-[acyl-carrier-protein] synthase III
MPPTRAEEPLATLLPGDEPTLRSTRTPRPAAIESVAMTVPERVVRNDEIASSLGVSDDWIVARTGVSERRIAAPDLRLSDLATAAGRRALELAAAHPSEVDLVLVATVAADELSPNAGPLVARGLEAENAGAMDVGAACTGFLSALAIAAAQVEAGRANRVLVIGADILSRLTDTRDRRTAALFADGAGACLVGAAGGGGCIGPIVLGTDGDGAATIRASHADRLIRMQGHDTFREAVRRLSAATLQAAAIADVELDEIDLFVYHQANIRILDAVGERLGLERDRVIDCIDRYGNTSAASIPIALAEARDTGRLAPGDKVLLGAFGAGFTWGAGVVEWR